MESKERYEIFGSSIVFVIRDFPFFLFKIFKSIDFRINIFLSFKRNDKFFDFSLRF